MAGIQKFWGWNQPIQYDTVSRFGLKLKTDVYMRSSILSYIIYLLVIVLYLFERDFFLSTHCSFSMSFNGVQKKNQRIVRVLCYQVCVCVCLCVCRKRVFARRVGEEYGIPRLKNLLPSNYPGAEEKP